MTPPDRQAADELRIRVRTVPALAGLSWIRLGFRAFGRQPGGFMGLFGMFLLAVIATSLPLALLVPVFEAMHLGTGFLQLLGVVLLPLLSLGFMLGTEAVSNDLRIRPHLLFVPLARPGPGGRRSIIVLGLAYVAVLGLAALAGNGIDGGEARNWIVGRMGAQNAAAFDAASATLSDTGAAVLALKIAVVALGSIPLWHAPALVQWGRMGARQAMFGSVVALWRTRAAFTVFLLGWFAVGLLGAIALDLLALLLQGSVLFAFVAVIVSWIISATFYVTLWFGFVDTFDIRRPASERAAAIDAGDAGP